MDSGSTSDAGHTEADLAVLIAGTWQLESVGGNTVNPDLQAHLAFNSPSKLAGNSGCNQFVGRYSIDGNLLQIADNLATTRKMCLPGIMQIEQRLLQALQGQWQVEVVNDQLVFIDEHGKPQLQARKVIE
ncbi:META domain-containing protein [Gilvimarinus sp. 1_MG-2023]|uniref:META domain-containing protein n=1 Tax=Gilvimarinus sp. 1_MG-2023 TaxID=3062638 RepID=UPI0026E15115|nr:META domain-containing protein [Gilvimarinus sp. 1_MG-2023]MDO6745790.1 META domain-containing protein [Gilvimarinus sp. 1_MG-2023]